MLRGLNISFKVLGVLHAQDAVSTGGPLLALLGFIVLPLVWSVPEALVTAELATAFPEDSGYVAWVTAAFGPFWGFQEGWWSWLSGVTDNSVYPVLLLSYVDAVLPGAPSAPRFKKTPLEINPEKSCQEGWWSWLSGVTDNSVYPVLLLSYVDAVLPGAPSAPRFKKTPLRNKP